MLSRQYKPPPIKTYDSTRVYGALPARRRTKLLVGKRLMKIMDSVLIPGNGRWDILECGHRVRYYGDWRVEKRRCPECPTYDDENQLRLW